VGDFNGCLSSCRELTLGRLFLSSPDQEFDRSNNGNVVATIKARGDDAEKCSGLPALDFAEKHSRPARRVDCSSSFCTASFYFLDQLSGIPSLRGKLVVEGGCIDQLLSLTPDKPASDLGRAEDRTALQVNNRGRKVIEPLSPVRYSRRSDIRNCGYFV
jgi:hypothetical protein